MGFNSGFKALTARSYSCIIWAPDQQSFESKIFSIWRTFTILPFSAIRSSLTCLDMHCALRGQLLTINILPVNWSRCCHIVLILARTSLSLRQHCLSIVHIQNEVYEQTEDDVAMDSFEIVPLQMTGGTEGSC